MFHQRVERKSVRRLIIAMLASLMVLGTASVAYAQGSSEPAPTTGDRDQEIARLRAQVDALTRDNRRLWSKYSTQRTKNAKLNRANRNLTKHNTSLARANTKLRKAVTRFYKGIVRFRRLYRSASSQLRSALRRLSRFLGPWRSAKASWYGPGLYGSGLAGGGVLRPGMKIFAHRSMRFGTKVQFAYRGRTVVAVCRDRGPYVGGRVFDLGPGTAKALRFNGVGTVRWRYVR